jgi:hypothetical protein
MSIKIKTTIDKSKLKSKLDIVIKGIRSAGKPVAIQEVNKNLQEQHNVDGSAFPTKSESTKREYTKHGYNTNEYLVRTGQSTKLEVEDTPTGFVIKPFGQKILSYHSKYANFVYFDENAKIQIINTISQELRKVFNE